MTHTNAQPVVFRFDDSKSFQENGDAFLDAVDADDPEMSIILRENWDALVAVVCEGERNSRARGEFNAKVTLALDALVAKAAESRGGA